MKSIDSSDSFFRYHYFDLLFIDGSALDISDISTYIHDSKGYSCYIFLSRHKSSSGRPTLTCHTTGNFNDDTLGGRARELAYTYPSLQKCYMLKLWANRGRVIGNGYDIVIEATHHGPTALDKPVLFIEIGSSEKQWNDMDAISTVYTALISTIIDFKEFKSIGIALGGTHYPDKFTQLLIDSDIALASVASKYNLEYVDEHMLRQMIDKSVEEVNHIVLDWKGLGKEKERLLDVIDTVSDEYDLEVIKV
jgi:D-aminoacyl-tRNA deacylase